MLKQQVEERERLASRLTGGTPVRIPPYGSSATLAAPIAAANTGGDQKSRHFVALMLGDAPSR